ncbi:hypothetical protein Holit_02661 [Hollandina sp. SP2]
MKRSLVFILLTVAAGGLLSAQNRNPWGGPDPRSAPLETLKITGKLGIIQGMIALQDKDISYFVLGIDRFIGFIDGLKEGATVTIEGYSRASPNGEFPFLRATQLTINNKAYDLVPPEQGRSPVRPDFSYPPPQRRKSPRHCHRGY